MTSTPFNVGLGDGSRLSSRVLRPPGGGHTDIFGGDPEPPRGRRLVNNASATKSSMDELTPAPAPAPAPATNGTEAHTQNGNQHVESPQETPQQVNTAPPKTDSQPAKSEPVKPEPAKTEPAKRVRVPPGGFSSGLW